MSAANRQHSIYTVWAGLKDDPESVWMIWGCDEYTYQGDPDARDAELTEIKKLQGDEVEFREVTVKVDYSEVQARFVEGVVEGTVSDA